MIRSFLTPSLVNLLRLCLLTPLLLASSVGWTTEQKLPEGVKMHRTQAGTLDKDGWTVAKSTEGKFLVHLPVKFNDFTATISDPTSPVSHTYVIGGKSRQGVKFSATRLVYRKGAEGAKYYFDNFQSGKDFNPKPDHITPVKTELGDAVDVIVSNMTGVSYQRAILVESDLILLVVETPREQDAKAQKYVNAFVNSIELTGK